MMNECIKLPRAAAQGRGRVTISYADAVTGRVLEEIRGENHVFLPQLTGTTGFQTTAMKADLLLCQGGSYPDYDGEMKLPFIPGEPIGYGRPNAEGTGKFRGTYRAADSWVNRASRTQVSSKFVYDFLPTQALGRVDWVGLTAALGNGASIPAYAAPHGEFSLSARVYDCERGIYYRAANMSVDSTSHVKFAWMDCFSDTEEHSVDITNLAGWTGFRSTTSYPRTSRIFLEQGGEAVYILCRGTPNGTTKTVYKAVKVKRDGTEILGQWDITAGTEYIYESAIPGGAKNDTLWWMTPAEDYRGYRRYVCDLASGTITATDIALDTSGVNLLNWSQGVAFFYGSTFWYPRRDAYTPKDDGYSDCFLYGSPLFDMASGAVHGLIPPSTMAAVPEEYHVGVSPLAAFGGQWVCGSADGEERTMPFAYSCYAVPADTPQRPEGSAMSVTYELDISW